MSAGKRMGMDAGTNVRDVLTVVRKELRETLRDRRTLAVMVLFPMVVYPLISLLTAQVLAAKQATDETRRSRVALAIAPGAAAQPATRAAAAAALVKVRATLLGGPADAKVVDLADANGGAASDVADGRLDALIEVGAPAGDGATVPVRVVFDETHDTSLKARERVQDILGNLLPPGTVRPFTVHEHSVAPKSKVGGYVLSKILPLIVVVMTMLGAFYPAVDITAGERERGTLETLLSTPIRRFDLMTGKVLAVATLATLTGMLNIASMSLTVAEVAKLAGGGTPLVIPWTRAAATLLTIVPAAFLFGAVMVAVGAMARSFKEAQNLLTPVYLLCFTPALVATLGDYRLAGLALVVPGTNLTLLARDLMLGDAHVGPAIIVLASTLTAGAFALAFAARLYDSERMLASPDAQPVPLRAWLRLMVGAVFGRRDDEDDNRDTGAAPALGATPSPGLAPNPGHAVTLFAITFILWFFAFAWLQKWRLLPGLLISQWGGFGGVVILYARFVRRPLGDVLVVGRPNGRALLGALLVGSSAWVLLSMVFERLMPPPPELVEEMRKLIRPTDPNAQRTVLVSLFALAVTPAICEEALFRGPILRGLAARFSPMPSAIMTGILFGILHGDVWRLLPTALLGTLLGWIAQTAGSIVPSMLVHVLNNGAIVLLGYYGLDKAAEHLSPSAQAIALAAATALFVAGLALIRRSGRPR